MRLQTQQHRDVAVSLSPLPTFYPYLWCPCWCALYVFFCFWLVQELSAVPVILNCGGRGSLKKHVVIFFILFYFIFHFLFKPFVSTCDRDKGMSFYGLDFAPRWILHGVDEDLPTLLNLSEESVGLQELLEESHLSPAEMKLQKLTMKFQEIGGVRFLAVQIIRNQLLCSIKAGVRNVGLLQLPLTVKFRRYPTDNVIQVYLF